MIIGLDIDNTITRHPEFFASMTRRLTADGHRIVIITFREDREHTVQALSEWGICYDVLVTSTVQAHLDHGVDEWKGVVCRQQGVEIFFEDDPTVLRHVDPSVVCFMPVDPRWIPETAQPQIRAGW